MPFLAQKRAAERTKLSQLTPPEIDPHPNVYGVLLSDEIAFYAVNHQLITPFDRTNLKPAAYELTGGDEYFLSGEFLTLDPASEEKNKLIIPPFEVAVLKTTEILCLPRYLIARWNLRVKHAYSGLLWVGGPQVDPGYVGHLFCPIYSLSDRPVPLHMGDPIAVIDFVKTTPYDKDSKSADIKRYDAPPKRLFLEDYGIDALRSALFTRAGAKLAEFEEEIKNLGSRFITFTQISFAIFAIVIALVATTSKIGADNLAMGATISGALTLAISVAAMLIAFLSSVHWRVDRLLYEQFGRLMGSRAQEARRVLRRAWLFGISMSILVAVVAGVVVYLFAEPLLQSTELGELSTRVGHIEQNNLATVDALQKLKADLEQEIQALKSGTKPSDR